MSVVCIPRENEECAVCFSICAGIKARTAATGRHLATSIRGPVLWLILCGGLLVAAIFVGTIMMIGEFRERALRNSERELENTVLLLTRHFDQQFEDSDAIANDLISRMQISGMASPEIFRRQMSTSEAHEMLRSKVSVLSYLGDISIFDADGDMINWSRPLPAPRLNISERAYFKTFKSIRNRRSDPDRAGSQLSSPATESPSSPTG